MYLRIDLFGHYLEFGRHASEGEEYISDGAQPAPIESYEQYEHEPPLGFFMPGSGYDEEDV